MSRLHLRMLTDEVRTFYPFRLLHFALPIHIGKPF